jgi:hypothetical protein
LRRLVALATIVAAIAFVILAFSVLSGRVSSPVWRAFVAVILFAFLARIGVGYFRQATRPVAEPEPAEEVPKEVSLTYICEVCGLELAVLKVAKEKAPKHCGEEMKLVVETR